MNSFNLDLRTKSTLAGERSQQAETNRRQRDARCDRRTMNPRMVRESVPRNGQPNNGQPNNVQPNNVREVVMDKACSSTSQGQQMVARPRPSKPGKRPIKNVSPQEKVRAIDRVDNGESKASVARNIGVPESTLRGWYKSKHKIRSQCDNMPANNSLASSSTGSRQSCKSDRRSVSGSPEEDGPSTSLKKMIKSYDYTARQNSPQYMAIPGPSTSSSNGAYLGCVDNRNINVVGQDPKASIDYASFVAATMMTSINPEQSHIALQQLSPLNPHLTKNLFNMTTLGQPPTVSLVENGLQYSRSNRGRTLPSLNSIDLRCVINDPMPCTLESNMQHTMGNAIDYSINKHMAIAPAQMTARLGTRKSPSVSPAAEAPSTPVAASPNENNAQPSTSRSRHSTGNIGRIEDGMWTWLLQQHRMLNGQTTELPPIDPNDGHSWFWHWWKSCSFPLMLGQSATSEHVRAMLDAVLGANTNNTASNMNGNVSRGQNNADERYYQSDVPMELRGHNVVYEDEDVPMEPMETTMDNNPGSAGIEEAIEHGDRFLEWLENCSTPSISRMQIVQFRYLLDTLKLVRDLSPRQSRRDCMESAAQQNHHI